MCHARLGHLSDKVLKVLYEILNLKCNLYFSSNKCEICPLAKFRRLYFVSNNHRSPNPFDLVHCDIWGPYHQSTYDGKRYFLTLVDDCTRFTWAYLMSSNVEAAGFVISFFKLIKTQFGITIKQFRSDNAKELFLSDFLKEQRTINQFPYIYRPQQNVVVERKHQHLLNVTRSLLFPSKVPLNFRGDCLQTATFLINRVPSPIFHNKTPFEMLYNKDPSYDNIRVFGCLCFAATLPPHRTKLEPRATPAVFVGYPLRVQRL